MLENYRPITRKSIFAKIVAPIIRKHDLILNNHFSDGDAQYYICKELSTFQAIQKGL